MEDTYLTFILRKDVHSGKKQTGLSYKTTKLIVNKDLGIHCLI